MLFYFLLLIFLLFIFLAAGLVHPSKRLFLQYIGCFTLIVISVLRFDVGWDYPIYWELEVPTSDSFFSNLFVKNKEEIYDQFYKCELIPRFIYLVTEYINWRPLAIILFGTITYILTFKTLFKWCSCFAMGFFFYLALFYWDTLGIIRQALAVSIVFFSLKYIADKRFFKFLLTIFFAGLCHKSAFCLICLYPLYHYVSLKCTLFGCLISVLTFSLMHTVLFKITGYAAYLDPTTSDSLKGGDTIFLLNLFYCILSGILLHLIPSEQRGINIKLFKFLILGSVVPIIFGNTLGGRFALYFNIFQLIVLPNLFCILFKHTQIIKLAFCLAVSTFSLYFLYFTTLNERKSPFTPYRCVLFTDTNIFKQDPGPDTR